MTILGGKCQRIAWCALVATLATACNINPFRLSSDDDGDGGIGDGDGGIGIDANGTGIIDAGVIPDADLTPDACPARDEVCDGMDNDCDTEIDEDFNFESDPANCGGCGMACSRPNMAGTCASMTCQFECLPGFVDLDGDIDTGCEYLCVQTNGGVEACDFTDNDCDGEVDEGLDLETDVNNCGACGRPCIVLHATPQCVDGVCGHSVCEDGFEDILPGVPGCEYDCPVFPTTAETCNAIDEDCDGVVDELPIAGLGDPCIPPEFAAFGEKGECTAGAQGCIFGTPACVGYVGPTGEICDGMDNDCDDVIDNGFDKDSDPRNCGPDCEVCSFTNGIAGCTAGACTLVACNIGFVDADGNPNNGCEYECSPTGPEVCDGVDNDCDTLTDTADPDLEAPPAICLTGGACAGTVAQCAAGPAGCDTTVKWRCIYGGATEADACGDLPLQEAVCDDIDGDCDTRVDESFNLKGSACDDGELGECLGTGTLVCNAAGTALECNITDPGAVATAGEQACDGLDEDCNGILDDNAPDTEVRITRGGLDFFIDVFEASRPDANAGSPGVLEHRSCSNEGVKPWFSVSFLEAEQACLNAGKRLCTETEWQEACEGVSNFEFPYGDTYDPEACNGNDYDADCTAPDEDICLPTGTANGCPTPPGSTLCVSSDGTVDQSGNLKEWTGTEVVGVPNTYRIRGGAFDSVRPGLTCQFDFVSGGEDFFFPNLGFRCCRDPQCSDGIDNDGDMLIDLADPECASAADDDEGA